MTRQGRHPILVVPATKHEARGLLEAGPMRQWFAAALVSSGAMACGQVDFGSSFESTDLGVEPQPDLGVLPTPDVGVDAGDTGPEPDDCLQVELPESLPTVWPFSDDQATYQTLFLDWAQDAAQSCTSCHSVDRNLGPPLIVSPEEIDQYADSRAEVWSTIASSELKASESPLTGPLWRHVEEHEDFERSWTYTPEQVQFLEDLVFQAWGCQVPAAIAVQDAGPECGPPPPPPPVDAGDAGVTDGGLDGGGPDAGIVDSGDPPTTFEPCYCDEQPDAGPVDNTFCAPVP